VSPPICSKIFSPAKASSGRASSARTGDVGLGQLTEDGADTTLFWNPSFFGQFCPLVLSSEACGKGYLHLDTAEQEMLRSALVVRSTPHATIVRSAST